MDERNRQQMILQMIRKEKNSCNCKRYPIRADPGYGTGSGRRRNLHDGSHL